MSNVVRLPVPNAETERLLQEIAERKPEAIATVYRLHAARVRAFARRMLHDESAAEDVVHDAFVALPKAVLRFRQESSLETFLISIAVNLCRHRLRSGRRGRKAVERLAMRPEEPATTPEAETRRRELAAVLRRGMQTLSEDLRETFVLCSIEERTSAEVAEILSVPAGTVRTRLFHARRKLREYLEHEGVR